MTAALRLGRVTLKCGKRDLLSDVSAQWPHGHLAAVLGRNGAGKSTLLRAIAGLNGSYTGTIEAEGTDIRTLGSGALARRLAFVSTERVRVPSLSSFDAVAMGRAPYTGWRGLLSVADRKIVAAALATVGMADFAARSLDNMSDGERQRIMVARALAQDTPILLLDEPTSFLDLPGRHRLCTLLRTLARDGGKCVLFTTHELDLAMRYADSVTVFHQGRLLTAPTSDEATRGILDEVFEIT